MRDITLTSTQVQILNETVKSLRLHKQAFVHAAPSLGKTYIAVSMIEKTVKSSPKSKIILISTKNSITNTLSRFGNEDEFINNVIAITFDELKRKEDYIKEFNKLVPNKENVKLIIIDEAHKALANKTYIALKKILDRLSDKKIIAMTATPQRMDGKNTAKILTPLLTEGEDYIVRDINYCLENNIIHRYEYLDFNVRLYKLAFKTMMKLIDSSKLDSKYINKALALKESIDKCINNIYSAITTQLHSRYDFKLIENQGERWFVFFNTIKEAKSSLNSVKEMFKSIYNKDEDDEIEVRIHLFTNELSSSKSKEITDMLNSEPDDKVIDVILTVDKGTESLHPINMRGIIQMGNTQSSVREVQQLGRALTANINKDSDFGVTFVVDVCKNIQSLDNAPSIIGGIDCLDDRDIGIRADADELLDEYNKCMNKLDDILGQGTDRSNVSIMGDDIDNAMQTLKLIIDTANDDETVDRLIGIYNDNATEENDIPVVVFSIVDTREGTTFRQQYLSIKRKFVNEYFGKHNIEYKKNELYNKIYNAFGYRLFAAEFGEKTLTYENLTITLDKLVSISNDVNKYIEAENGDIEKAYSNRISKTSELKKTISQLQFLALSGKLSINYYKFCIKFNIDITGRYTKLVEEALSYIDNEEMLKDFKYLLREYKQVTDLESAEKAVARFYIFRAKYYLKHKTTVDICYTALKLKFNAFKIVKHSKKYTSNQLNKAFRLADAINKFTKSSGEDLTKFNTEYQTVILDVLNRNDLSTEDVDMLNNIEICILNNLWKNIDNSRRNSNLNKLITITPFYYKYTNFVDGNSRTSLDYTYIMNLKDSCNEARRLTNSKSYKQAVAEYSSSLNNKQLNSNKNHDEKIVKSHVINRVRANTIEELLYTIESGAVTTNNKKFVTNSLNYLNVSDEQFIMTIVGSNNGSNKYADKFNSILVMGMHETIDSIIINKIYNTMSPKRKKVIRQLVKIGYCDSNDKLNKILNQLIV